MNIIIIISRDGSAAGGGFISINDQTCFPLRIHIKPKGQANVQAIPINSIYIAYLLKYCTNMCIKHNNITWNLKVRDQEFV